MARTPSKSTINAWVKLLRAHNIAMSAVENALKTAKLPQLSWYDVLLELDRAGSTGLRQFELEGKLLLPQYGMSRLLARIEKEELITRAPCNEDGRGQVVVITEKGKQLKEKMWPIYAAAVQDQIGEKFSVDEAKVLTELLSRIS